jgi:hypothetical protein
MSCLAHQVLLCPAEVLLHGYSTWFGNAVTAVTGAHAHIHRVAAAVGPPNVPDSLKRGGAWRG